MDNQLWVIHVCLFLLVLIKLKQRQTIRKRIAWLLLIVFMVSTAPKTYLHEAIATHKDVSYCTHIHETSACLHLQGFNCHFDNLVVTAPYIFQSYSFSLVVPIRYLHISTHYLSSYHSIISFSKDNRGPPAA